VETKGVCRLREGVLRPFVKRRTNTAQSCTIFNQGNRRPGMAMCQARPGASVHAHRRLGGTSGLELETAAFCSAEVI
jgi:hypothetical protein